MIVILGQNATMLATFINEDNTPFEVDTAVTYKIFDFNNTFILENSAIQDNLNPSTWYANFMIPENAPMPDDMMNQQYYIEFYARNSTNQLQTKEYFQVLNQAEPNYHDSGVLLLANQNLTDKLITQYPVVKFKLTIMDENNRELKVYERDEVTSRLVNNEYITDFNSEAPTGLNAGDGMFAYLLLYNYTDSVGNNNIEVHTLYIIDALTMLLINNMRRYLDKARNYDIDPTLRWTDVELAHFILSGIQRFNTSGSKTTNLTLNTFPKQLFYVLEKLAEVEALNALYLAEGMRAFEFSGASTTLNVDRTQYIQTKMDEINGWLDENLNNIKSSYLRGIMGAGVNGISLTSVTNRYGYNWRSPMYTRLINGFK